MSSLKLFTIALSAAVLSACGGGKVVPPNSPEQVPTSSASSIVSSLGLVSSSKASSIIASSSLISVPASSSSRSSSSIALVASSVPIASSVPAVASSIPTVASSIPRVASSVASSIPAVLSSSSVAVSSTATSALYVRGTHNAWADLDDTYLMTRVGSSNKYQICINFTDASPAFKVDLNGGWGGDEIPAGAANRTVAAGWVNISFDSVTKTISTEENLTANCGTSTASSSGNVSSVAAGTSSSSVDSNNGADVKAALGTLDSRLACYKGAGEKACNLRTYQIMVEAFVNGDDSINMNTGYGTSQHKGDLQGVINSLDYIKSLGVNTLWLTPVFDSTNGGNPNQMDATGYFASNFFNVDKYFGTKDKLKELVDTAHAKGLYVLLDGVFGHSKGQTIQSPTGKALTPMQVLKHCNGNETDNDNTQCYPYPNNLEFFKEVAAYWVTNYKIDGWRLDQAYQVPVQYWDDIRAVVETASASVTYTNSANQTVNPLGYMVGELWLGETDIASKGYGSAGSPGLLSAFDFPARYRLVQTLAVEESGKGKTPATTLNEGYKTQEKYPAHAMPNLMLTNHDLVRFGDLIQRGSIAGPNDDQYWLRHKAAMSFMAAYSGPITLYYGDEIGQEVANFAAKVDNGSCSNQGKCDDHVSRDQAVVEGVAGSINDRQRDLKAYVASLMTLRDAHPALWNGSRTHIHSNASVFIDRKDAGSDHILYALNTTNAEVRISIAASAIGASGNLTDLLDSTVYSNQDGVYYLVLSPFKAAFLKIAN